jgi:hypothetical protein
LPDKRGASILQHGGFDTDVRARRFILFTQQYDQQGTVTNKLLRFFLTSLPIELHYDYIALFTPAL